MGTRRRLQPRLPLDGRLEVHEHSYVSGPHARWSPSRKLVHSHAGGERPHQHPQTGPAAYTIDKDEWEQKTGMKGGSRKKFTKQPTGEQMPIVELEDWQKSFEIVIGPPPADYIGEGPGLAPAARMVLGFGMKIAAVRSLDDFKKTNTLQTPRARAGQQKPDPSEDV